jgi:hypothetical protein
MDLFKTKWIHLVFLDLVLYDPLRFTLLRGYICNNASPHIECNGSSNQTSLLTMTELFVRLQIGKPEYIQAATRQSVSALCHQSGCTKHASPVSAASIFEHPTDKGGRRTRSVRCHACPTSKAKWMGMPCPANGSSVLRPERRQARSVIPCTERLARLCNLTHPLSAASVASSSKWPSWCSIPCRFTEQRKIKDVWCAT